MKKKNKEDLHTPARDAQRKGDRKYKVQDEFDDPSASRLNMESEISKSSDQEGITGDEEDKPQTRS